MGHERASDAVAGRFEVRGRLGAGGMGTVHRVFDRARGHEVALKVLQATGGRELYRFKREFRFLADLSHPNVVRLYELHTIGDEWMFTMELIDGVPFHRWVRPVDVEPEDDELTRPRLASHGERVAVPGRLDLDRLRDALGQVADAVVALHATGKLHRDLKPSNVLVTREGRVVILDFGLVAHLDAPNVDHTHEQAAVGTPMYMSPEQAADLPLTEASDWYAVGVMLYEVLAGVRPFIGTSSAILVAKQTAEPAPPSVFAPGVPRELDALCLALLARDPRARPDGAAVLAALGRTPSAATERLRAAARPGPFVGRGPELAALREALVASRAQATVVLVSGSSGMGKSALVRAFLDEASADGAPIILSGHCYERETVPFKTLDEVIDALTSHLTALPAAEVTALLPESVGELVRLFPVVRRVPGIAASPLAGMTLLDPLDLRRRGLAQLRRLLVAIAARRPFVIAIDNLQWGDLDGIQALAELLVGADAPRLLFVGVHRAEDADGEVLAALHARLERGERPVRHIVVGELADGDARQLWAVLGGTASDTRTLASAGGVPLLIGEIALARASGGDAVASIEDVVRLRVERLDAPARALLRATAIAGRPLRTAVLAAATGETTGELALSALVGERLVRCHAGRDLLVEPYHDRIREAVVAGMTEAERVALHARLAEALDGEPDIDPELVIQHWLAAGDLRRATALAVSAAHEAHQRLAVFRAATLYELALRGELTDAERHALTIHWAEVLTASGRLVEAAAAFEQAAAQTSGPARFALERQRVEQLLRAGQSGLGLAAGTTLLAAVGVKLPSTWRGTFASFVYQRLRLRLRGLAHTPRPVTELEPDTLDRLDVLWSMASGFTLVDPLLGRVLQAQFLRTALDAGEPGRLASALALEVGYQAIPGLPALARYERILATTRAIAERVGDRARLGLFDGCAGIGSFLMGRFAEARARLEAGLEAMADDPVEMRWHIDVGGFFLVTALWWLGDLRALVAVHERVLADAEERGNVYVQRGMRGWRSNVAWLIRGQVAVARAQAERARSPRGPAERFHLHHYYDLVCDTLIDLYDRRGGDAHRRIEAAAREVARSHLLRIQATAIEFHWLRGVAAIAAPEAERDLAQAARAERILDATATPQGRVLAGQLRACRALAAGDRDGAVAALRATTAAAAAAELGVHLAVARLRLGTLLGGVDGDGLVATAERWMTEQGVADPAALAQMLSPAP